MILLVASKITTLTVSITAIISSGVFPARSPVLEDETVSGGSTGVGGFRVYNSIFGEASTSYSHRPFSCLNSATV